MSTILDALKKSEQERKLNKLPTLSDMPAPQEPSRWPLVVGSVLCVVALIILLATVFLWGKGASSKLVESKSVASIESSANVQILAEAKPITATSNDDVVVNAISYSEELSQRFAMVNGKMVREGEFVRAGLQVEQINLDTVVLNFRGKQITRKP